MSELADFVLNALRQADAIVEPPAYGVYEALLPEEIARRWGVPAYQRLAFADQAPVEAASQALAEIPAGVANAEDVTVVGYGHPLVDTLMEQARARPACSLVYVNDVRLDKRGLLALAQQALAFPNARLSELPRQDQAAALCYYVRFNFGAALITDEKRERLVSVVMDAQAGFPVPELAHLEQLTQLEEESAFKHLPPAPVRWSPGHQPLSRPVLDGLLERATRAALDELAVPLEGLRRRTTRYLELDRARLAEYYDGIARDLQRRIERAGDDARRISLEEKLAVSQAEREAKLADVEAKYRLRVELELINLQVTAQPKLFLPVRIGNRIIEIERAVAWDPLLHRLEPLACDVCGQPGTRLTLCTGGHLAHEGCLLAEQCVDCRRIYCRRCADQMGHCVVCERPVCVHSLNRCRECGRATCREHVGLCHAADGLPVTLPRPQEQVQPVPEPPLPPPPVEQVEEPPAPVPPRQEKKRREVTYTTHVTRAPAASVPRPLEPHKIEVHVEPEVPVVHAWVLTKGKKQIAVRSWELAGAGIQVTCWCEKRRYCRADGRLLVPAEGAEVEAFLEEQIEDLRREYGVPARQVFRYAFIRGASRQVPRVVLRGRWRAGR